MLYCLRTGTGTDRFGSELEQGPVINKGCNVINIQLVYLINTFTYEDFWEVGIARETPDPPAAKSFHC